MPMDLVLAHKSNEEDFNSELGDNLDEFTALAVKLLKERAQLQQNRYYTYIQVQLLAIASCGNLMSLTCDGFQGEHLSKL